ncbi:MAG TPA: hypothetical protein VJC11_01565 [Patescibacteria group bacterium]|nr:hypothetical protein [Patescibacteria group bacterium]
MNNKKSTKTSQLDIIARHVAEMHATMVTKDNARNFATKNDLNNFATKDDLKAYAKRTEEQFDEIRGKMATKDDIRELEAKLIDDTGAITGVEQKHFRSHAQRITRLEKAVFPA